MASVAHAASAVGVEFDSRRSDGPRGRGWSPPRVDLPGRSEAVVVRRARLPGRCRPTAASLMSEAGCILLGALAKPSPQALGGGGAAESPARASGSGVRLVDEWAPVVGVGFFIATWPSAGATGP